MDEIIVRYFHFIGIIILSSMLVAENVLIAKELENRVVKKLATIDGLYGIGAVLTLIAGLLLWLYVGKSKEFYTYNTIFHIKLGLFLFVGIMSIIPTIFLLKNRRSDLPVILVPNHILTIKRLELILLLIIPLLAVLMARGIGNG